jgi:hypothetical protein
LLVAVVLAVLLAELDELLVQAETVNPSAAAAAA